MQGLHNPLGGCMLLSMVLADGLFSGLSAENFNAPFKPKMGAFEVLCDIVDMKKLDFLISFSSVSALFGNAGQTNYSAYVFSVVCIIYTFGTHVLQSKYYVGCQTARHAQCILYCNTLNHGLIFRYEKRNEDEAYDGLGNFVSKSVVPWLEYRT